MLRDETKYLYCLEKEINLFSSFLNVEQQLQIFNQSADNKEFLSNIMIFFVT